MQVASGQTPQAAARAAGVCPCTVRKWVARYAAERVASLRDCSSRPHRLNRPTPQHIVARIGERRPQRLSGTHIAASVGVSTDTVSRVLK
jgi:transposase